MATEEVETEIIPAAAEEEVTLMRRRRRGSRHGGASTDTSCGVGDVVVGLESGKNGRKSQSEEEGEEGKGRLDEIIHLEEDTGTSHTNEYSGIEDGNVEHLISLTRSKNENLDVTVKDFVIQNSPSSSTTNHGDKIVEEQTLPRSNVLLSLEQATFSKRSNSGTEEQLDANSIVQTDQDVVELDLERFLEDLEAYDFYCPNCNGCIKKVLLCKRQEKSRPPRQAKPVEVFRCMSCFSFLILAGRRFVSLFVPDQKEDPIDQGGNRGRDLLDTNSAEHPVSPKETIISVIPEPKKPDDKMVNVRGKQQDAKEKDTDEYDTKRSNAFTGSVIEVEEKSRAKDKQVVEDAALLDQSQFLSSIQDAELLASNVSTKDTVTSTTRGPGELKEVMIKIRGNTKDAIKMTDTVPVEPVAGTSEDIASSEEAILEPQGAKGLDILKSIVYGGLIESITSLGIVTSAVGANADTVKILALGLANLIGGLFVLGQNLWELKINGFRRASNQTNDQIDRYQELLGQKQNFSLHAMFAVLSFLIFGTVPLVTYAFSFRKSDVKELKLAAATAASLFCIIILATGKAHIQKPPKLTGYLKTVIYYAFTGVVTSFVSFIVGDLILKLMEKLGWFKSSGDLSLPLPETTLLKSA